MNSDINKKSNSKNDTQGIIESGDIFFFYRPKIGSEEVKDIEDVQRFYIVTSYDVKKDKDKNYRLFMLGRKKMPEIVKEKSTSEERTGH